MSVLASFIQGPWNNSLAWKAPGAWKGLMTDFRCYYLPTKTPAIWGAKVSLQPEALRWAIVFAASEKLSSLLLPTAWRKKNGRGSKWSEVLVAQLCLTLYDPSDCSPLGFSIHGDSPGKNTGVGCHALLQGIFLTQKLNWSRLCCWQILYQLN